MLSLIPLGICYYSNGTYEGGWKDGMKNGHGKLYFNWLGVFYYINGNQYDGSWHDDKMNGRGKGCSKQ